MDNVRSLDRGCFILCVTRLEIDFQANRSRFKPTSVMSLRINKGGAAIKNETALLEKMSYRIV
jgi:hypothetical protein